MFQTDSHVSAFDRRYLLGGMAIFCFQSAVLTQTGYRLVQLRNGVHCVHSLADAETFHPGIGPAAEAEALYVRQLRLAERAADSPEEFVIWDIGFGAAANAFTAIRLITQHLSNNHLPGKKLRITSFDRTTDAAAFAVQHSAKLGYLMGFESHVSELIEKHSTTFDTESLKVTWTVELGDFPFLIGTRRFTPVPHAILFDPHSPKKNPEMWTVPLFAQLFDQLGPERPCSLANFTRSTMARAALLLGGFFVGVGHASGLKEETTVAANRLELIHEPLGIKWLERAQRSGSAEPMIESHYRQAPLSSETLAKLKSHPQFHLPQ